MEVLSLLFAGLAGLCIGSFLNVVILRLHGGETLSGRSHCARCQHTLSAWDLVPLLSYVWLRGRCGYCSLPISWQYPVVELATALLFVWSAVIVGWSGELFLYWFIAAALVVVFVYDLRWMLVPDQVTLPAIVIIALANGLLFGVTWTSMLLAAMIGGGFFALQHLISRGRWVGSGDIVLGVLAGVIVGWPLICAVLLLAYWLGGIVGIMLVMSRQKRWASQMPFGVFLAPVMMVVLLYQAEVLKMIQTYFYF